MPVIKVGSFDLDYADTGSGPPAVLVHSSASGYRQWHQLVTSFQGRYRLIAVNLFGYGKTSSWPGSRPLTSADEAELVAAAVELAREPVALVGHSLGGAVPRSMTAQPSAKASLLKGDGALASVLFVCYTNKIIKEKFHEQSRR